MSTERFPENRSVGYSSSHWRSVAIVFASLVTLTILGGIGVRRQYASSVPVSRIDAAQSTRYPQTMMPVGPREPSFASTALLLSPTPTGTPPPESLSSSQPPDVIQPTAATAPSATEGQVNINFDEFSSPTVITNQYPPAVFSTDSPWYVEAHGRVYYGSSFPNYLDRGPYVQPHGYVPLYVDFTSPVNNLRFYVVGADNSTVIAQINIFQNRRYSATANLIGRGTPFTPVLIDLGSSGFSDVTRIEIVNINDPNGIGFDDFSFTTAPPPSPTPTPTPAPTQPAAPTNVKATPDEAQISVSWSVSPGASSYTVKRSQTASSTSTSASGPESTAFVSIGSPFFCDGVSVPCFFTDNGLDSTLAYSYVIAATNAVGTSPDSNPPASAKPLPKPGCQSPTKSRPASRNVTRHGWNMEIDVTDDEGLKLRNVSLNGRLMAESMSVPYFRLGAQTLNGSSSNQRGQLKPAGDDPSLRSRLVDYKVIEADPDKLVVSAKYEIDRIPAAPNACLNISQQYEFYREGFHGRCEPSGTITCARFRPMVTYSFHGGDREFLTSLNIPQRHHYLVRGVTGNTVGVFLDPDSVTEGFLNLGYPAKMNPVTKEFWATTIGRAPGNFASAQSPSFRFDNFHQTNQSFVVEAGPTLRNIHFISPGCPECVHNHWRWSAFLGSQWGSGRPLIPPDSTQTVDMGVVRYPGIVGPGQEWLSLVNGEDLYTTGPLDPVFWFSPTGYMPSDTLFYHAAWFSPHPPAEGAANITLAVGSQPQTTTQDGPVSVTFGDIYQTGSTSFAPFDLSTVAPLPAGYAPLNNAGYMITTTAVVSGPHVFTFSAASVSDQQTFNNLRIFHPEPDPFDPDAFIWVDRTILPADSPAPDFSSKLLSARSEGLGLYVIAKLVQTVPPSTDVANLAVTCSDSADPITAGNNLTYTVRVTNNGPQTANNVAIRNGLSPDAKFVSANPSQGTCKEIDGTVYCNLNPLAAGATATITIIVKPTEGTDSFPVGGKTIYNATLVKARESDNTPDNNSATETTTVLPNPNKAPTVTLTSPTTGALLVGPTNIAINAIATDSDGTISKVEFFDNGELIGVGTLSGNNQYVITRQNTSFGDHSLIAVATDNGGRQNISNAANVIVNGAANVSVTNPSSGALFAPASNIPISANATHPSGIISKVEFFANGESIGVGTSSGGSQYSLPWSNVDAGNYSLVAVATDGSGITTTSAPVSLTVGTPPTISISSPVENTVFPSLTNISVSATAQSTPASIARVDFYASGVLIGSASDVGTDRFTLTWRHVADGFYSLTAVAIDNLGLTTTSPAVQIAVNTVPTSGELVWFDDSLPAGATPHGDWYWVDGNPAPIMGGAAHQSKRTSYGPPAIVNEHSFDGATSQLPINTGDVLFTYVFLDPNNLPREIMLQWNDGTWNHRAYWGANILNYGLDGTDSRRYMGPLPAAARWVRLEVPASLVGLESRNINGMAFTLDGARATWDGAGKRTQNTPMPTSSDFVWVEDAVPTGSILETVEDQWLWLEPHFSGTQGHRSILTVSGASNSNKFRSHSFRGAQTTMDVQPGDMLFTYVFLDSNHMPDELVLQWNDGDGWEHRAFWGQNFYEAGIMGTESRRYMGGMPPGNTWVRLEVPASYVGLEGKVVSGMSYGFVSINDHAGLNWDYSGKSPRAVGIPINLSATAAVYQIPNGSDGVTYSTNDRSSQFLKFYAHPGKAAGTVPFYRFKRTGDNQKFYSRCLPCYDNNGWQVDGIAFYVYEDDSIPGTVPLYLYHDSQTHYFLTTDQNEANSHPPVDSSTWAYVFPTNPPVPATPSSLAYSNSYLSWQDNSANETGFRIEVFNDAAGLWTQLRTVDANVAFFKIGFYVGRYRVQAFNSIGNSGYSNEIQGWTVYNSPPLVMMSGPVDGEVVGRDVPIDANVFDNEGAGTIAKVEFFADNNKLGEVTTPPYSFVWMGAPLGSHVLTVKATDTAGASTMSSPISISVSANPPVFSDDFNDNSLDSTKWSIVAPTSPATVSEQAQQLRVTLPPNTAGYNGVFSNSTYDMRGKTVQVEVAQTVSQAGWCENFLKVELDTQNYFLINVGAGSMVFRSMTGGVNNQTVMSYDQSAFPYWRIRHDQTANMVSFETSSNGVNWTTRKTVTAGFLLTAVRFYLMAGAWGTGNSSPGAAMYDNFQLAQSGAPPAPVTNLALNKSATQVSTYSTAVAGRAVDGNTNGNYNNNSVTHTLGGSQEWWQVDLGSSYALETIKVWNRTDCCSDRLSNFYVFVSDQPFTSYDLATTLNQSGVSNFYTAGQGGSPTFINLNRTGRYVRVQLSAPGVLSLAEVEVMGSN